MMFQELITPALQSLTTPFTFYLAVLPLAFIIFIILRLADTPKTHTAVASAIIAILSLELFVRNYPYIPAETIINFGTYTFYIPHIQQEYTTTTAVMFLRTLDNIFNFGIFTTFGLPLFQNYPYPPLLSTPSPLLKLTVATVVIIDSLLYLYFLRTLFHSLSLLVSDKFNHDSLTTSILSLIPTTIIALFLNFILSTSTKATLIISLTIYALTFIILISSRQQASYISYLLGLIPVLVYTKYISNPIEEYHIAMPELQKLSYFLNNAEQITIISFSIILIIAFIMVMEIIAATVSFIYSAGAQTFVPSLSFKQLLNNTSQSIGFLSALSFAIMYGFHQYMWYLFFPAIIMWMFFKNLTNQLIQSANKSHEKQQLHDSISRAIRDEMSGRDGNITLPTKNNTRTQQQSNIPIYALIITGIMMLVVFVLWYTGKISL